MDGQPGRRQLEEWTDSPGEEDGSVHLGFRCVVAPLGDVVEDETVAYGPGRLDLDLFSQLRWGRGADGLQLPVSVRARLGGSTLLA